MKLWELNENLKEYVQTVMDMITDREDAALTVITLIVSAYDNVAKKENLNLEKFNQYVLDHLATAKKSRNIL